jgi:hypothetical protein
VFEYGLGEIVKDVITGFSGVIIGRCDYLTGCKQYQINPQKLDEKGIPQEALWIDESQVEKTRKKPLVLNKKGDEGPREAPKNCNQPPE